MFYDCATIDSDRDVVKKFLGEGSCVLNPSPTVPGQSPTMTWTDQSIGVGPRAKHRGISRNFHENLKSPLRRLAEHHVTIQVPPGGLVSNCVVSTETFPNSRIFIQISSARVRF